MSIELLTLRDRLSRSFSAILDERDDALNAGEADKAQRLQEEAEKLEAIVATVQWAINSQAVINLMAVANRLEESIQAQVAFGASLAITQLKATIDRLRRPDGGKLEELPKNGALAAKAGPLKTIIDKVIEGSKVEKIDPITSLVIVAIESDFKVDAQSPISSAGGLFQFIDSTWIGAGGPKSDSAGGKGNGHAAHASVDQQIAIGCNHIKSLSDLLEKRLGHPPTRTGIYMAHQQGFGGAMMLLSENPGKPVEDVIGEEAAKNNLLGGMTVGQAIDKFESLVRTHEDEINEHIVNTDTDLPPQPLPAVNIARPKAMKAARIAISEMETFARLPGFQAKEFEEPLQSRVLEYFRFVAVNVKNTSDYPWSAAFISFVMHKAGMTNGEFPKSASHARYILAGLENQINGRANSSILYYDREQYAPKAGDLIGYARDPSVKNRSDIAQFLPNKFFKSHTDLVVDVMPGKLKVIGGNVSDTIKTRTVKLTESGMIDPSREDYFFVLSVNV